MFYYAGYNPATDTRSVLSYDEQKHGAPRIVSSDLVFLYHGALCTRRVYNSEADVLAGAWGKYSPKPVIMPDGSETTPARYFGNDSAKSVFIPWSDVKGERWPGEY
nr:MAG TPA: hypothetical protein [Caudoviricetes sp.]